MKVLAASQWGPEQWVFVVTTCAAAVASAVVSVIAAVRTGRVHAEVRPPSNGKTAGALTENTSYSLQMLAESYGQLVGQITGKPVSPVLPAPPPLPERRTEPPAPA